MSEGFNNIREKLLYIQRNLKAPKSQYNDFGDYHYRSCEDIQEALKPLMEQTKTILLLNDELLQVGDRYYIKATAMLQDVESDGAVSNSAYARETDSRPKMDAAQITGSCRSYARKYALNGLFCIDDAKDPDYPVQSGGAKKPSGRGSSCAGATDSRERSSGSRGGSSCTSATGKDARVQQQHINKIRKEIARTGAKEVAVCYMYKIKNLQEMTIEQYDRAMAVFKQMPDKAPEPQETSFEGLEHLDGELPFR